jgi:hypothetical protein
MMKKRIHQIELFQKYPYEVQTELMGSLINKAAKTVYGQKFGFSNIRSVSDFQKQLPIQNYQDLFPYIDRIMHGEKNVLWPTEIKWFAKSSGTTNSRSKFIPVSNEALNDCHLKGGKDMLSFYFNNYEDTKMFTGKSLVIGGSHQVNQLNQNANSFYGDVSAVLISNLPWWAQLVRTPSLEIALMDEWEAKLEKMVENCLHENVTSISGVPTWTMVLLEKILAAKGADNLMDIWPNLEVFFHGAVAFGPYESQFKRLIPSNKMHYLETYNASEGFFGIQDQKDSKDMLLMLDYGIFYEFIPFHEIDSKYPKVLDISSVEIGKIYALIITTNAGLWRYRIGDTITFTSLNPHRIRIVGRTKHFINAFGEEVMIENAENAISVACMKTAAEISNFTAGPRYLNKGQKGCHEWVIEFHRHPDDLNRFTQILDETLREINSDYDAKRHKDIALVSPIVYVVDPGVFHNWMKGRGKLGGQNKVPRLANNREYLDEILTLIGHAHPPDN